MMTKPPCSYSVVLTSVEKVVRIGGSEANQSVDFDDDAKRLLGQH